MKLLTNARLNLFILLGCLALLVFAGKGKDDDDDNNFDLGLNVLEDFLKVDKVGYGSVVELNKDVKTLSNGQIAWFARQAAQEVKDGWRTWKGWSKLNDVQATTAQGKKKGLPTMMVVIAHGKRLYAASSMQNWGDNNIGAAYNKDLVPAKIDEALEQCSQLHGGTHLREGACGEIIAAWIALKYGVSNFIGVKIVAWTFGSWEVVNPCTPKEDDPNGKTFGCMAFTGVEHFDVIREGTKAEDPDPNCDGLEVVRTWRPDLGFPDQPKTNTGGNNGEGPSGSKPAGQKRGWRA